jgi:hypothetical protein
LENHSEALGEVDLKLHMALEVAKKTLEIANYDFPQIEDSFASAHNGIQQMADQMVKANKSFHIVKHQLQSCTEALNDSINSLISDIDELCALIKNIHDEDFASGDYFDIFSELGLQVLKHLVKT